MRRILSVESGFNDSEIGKELSVCTLLGAPNAIIHTYCQFENAANVNASSPSAPIIAFCYNQARDERRYDFYLLHVTREYFGDKKENSILSTRLVPLSRDYSVIVSDDAVRGGTVRSVAVTDAQGRLHKKQVSEESQDDIELVGEAVRTLEEAFKKSPKNPAHAWLETKANSESAIGGILSGHVPGSIESNIRLSMSGDQAFKTLQDATRHPADAPVLRELYMR